MFTRFSFLLVLNFKIVENYIFPPVKITNHHTSFNVLASLFPFIKDILMFCLQPITEPSFILSQCALKKSFFQKWQANFI